MNFILRLGNGTGSSGMVRPGTSGDVSNGRRFVGPKLKTDETNDGQTESKELVPYSKHKEG